ncbi:flagellar biosynthetic protein FliR [Marinagarivorans cellulosilyticus]|uniref:Flagellar biosynthetic protein FliR n=1 Tax=Marinagarivorans cellulosilyticus TaxID=2721545 RepID=A0AAN1WJT3_9GAMM|nr:flagellar biosynthetic protein FliR [Marinagarivorans cellulosilyticus]BCD98946.1 flagellar biosynthetic protein FliR [Marinagarivorans cellulosilyticus]
MNFTFSEIDALFQMYLMPFFRIGALFLTMPVIGTRVLPARSRVIMAFVITIIVAPLIPQQDAPPILSVFMLGTIGAELLVGGAVGFVFQVVFQCFVLSGQLIAMKIGLGFASMNDPVNGVQTTVISQFYLVAATLLFIAFDGHLVLLELVVESFYSVKLGDYGAIEFYAIAGLGTWLFTSALLMSIALLTALLLVNIAFGIMSRAAPQLNIFAVGFPFTLTLGMILIYIGLGGMLEYFERIVGDGFMFVRNMVN